LFSNITMTFKALLYKCYAEGGPKARKVRGRGLVHSWNFLDPWVIWAPSCHLYLITNTQSK